MSYTACCLTGHRELAQGFDKNALYDKLSELIDGGCLTFLCGMARGFDLEALECLAALRQRKKIFVEACLPYAGHERSFPAEEKERYFSLLEWCDVKTTLFQGYTKGCFLARDRYMVDCADVVLAYMVKRTGGTAYTVSYAEKKGIPVILLG